METKMKRMLVLISTLLLAGNALADDPPGKLDRLSDCRADVQKLCPNVQPGGGRIVACLRQNKDSLSDACKQRLLQMRPRRSSNPQNGQPGNTNNDN
jgi:hypothetical protein